MKTLTQELVEALREAANCLFVPVSVEDTQRTINRIQSALARAEREAENIPLRFCPVECVNGPVMVAADAPGLTIAERRAGLYVRAEDFEQATGIRFDK